MRRRAIEPRPGWQTTIEQQGLIYWRTDLPDGSVMPYWHEAACYELDIEEVYELEAVTRVLLEMLVEAGDHVIEHGLFDRMGIPGWAVPRIVETWESEPPMLYGRFDFAYGPDRVPKLLEYNADTPTCLVETAVQWHWMSDVFGEGTDQWNRVHEALVDRLTELRIAGRLPDDRVHFVHTREETSGEDFMTVGYLAECARQAGLRCHVLAIEDLGYHEDLGFIDHEGRHVRTCFKLYPWEWMVHQEFAAPALEHMGVGETRTQWIEPIWKMLWSNKGILAVLHELFPGNPHVLPAYFADDPRAAELRSFVRKPLLAREGANCEVVLDGRVVASGPDQDYGEEGFVVQAYADLGEHDGNRPVLGVWTVDMEPQGLGIRESDGLVTDNLSRFCPHVVLDSSAPPGTISPSVISFAQTIRKKDAPS